MESQLLHPIVLNVSLIEFIEYILKNYCAPTTMLICGTRQNFLRALLNEINSTLEDKYENDSTSDGADDDKIPFTEVWYTLYRQKP